MKEEGCQRDVYKLEVRRFKGATWTNPTIRWMGKLKCFSFYGRVPLTYSGSVAVDPERCSVGITRSITDESWKQKGQKVQKEFKKIIRYGFYMKQQQCYGYTYATSSSTAQDSKCVDCWIVLLVMDFNLASSGQFYNETWIYLLIKIFIFKYMLLHVNGGGIC